MNRRLCHFIHFLPAMLVVAVFVAVIAAFTPTSWSAAGAEVTTHDYEPAPSILE